MIRVAVVGAGQFGRNHIRVVSQSPRAELAAVVDVDAGRAREAAAAHGCEALTTYGDLPGKAEAAVVAVPTHAHAEVGCRLMEAGLDVLVEKPIAHDLRSADDLIRTAAGTGRVLQIGHLERFNPGVLALQKAVTLPLFFEIHRLSVFSPRSLDVDVVLDLMIHDIDILLNLVGSELAEIRAAGISVLSPKVDIANVRLQFRNGCVSNMTASRVSTERVRKLRLFQPRQYISLDYSRQRAVVFTVGEDRQVSFQELKPEPAEPLQLQFEAFLDCVQGRGRPKVDGQAARRDLEVALDILDKIKMHSALVAEALIGGWKP
jgi:predicted dehydrogenase